MTAVDHQLVKRFRQDAGDRVAEQRRQDQVAGVTPMSTEDERQYARAVIAQILEEHARSEINAGVTSRSPNPTAITTHRKNAGGAEKTTISSTFALP